MTLSNATNPSAAITDLLSGMHGGNPDAITELMPLIYGQLRQIAASQLRREWRGSTLQPSDLLQEACLRLVKPKSGPWENRHHFFASAARSMRQTLVDHARARGAKKRRDPRDSMDLIQAALESSEALSTILEVDDALKRLAKLSRRQSRIVELRFFAGLTIREVAAVLGLGITVVKDEWAIAKAWLRRELGKSR